MPPKGRTPPLLGEQSLSPVLLSGDGKASASLQVLVKSEPLPDAARRTRSSSHLVVADLSKVISQSSPIRISDLDGSEPPHISPMLSTPTLPDINPPASSPPLPIDIDIPTLTSSPPAHLTKDTTPPLPSPSPAPKKPPYKCLMKFSSNYTPSSTPVPSESVVPPATPNDCGIHRSLPGPPSTLVELHVVVDFLRSSFSSLLTAVELLEQGLDARPNRIERRLGRILF